MSSLDKIQFRAIRLCLGLRKTTPTNIILAEAGESPLCMRFKYLTSKYILKIFSLDSHPAIDKLYGLFWYSRNSPTRDPHKKFLLYKSFCNLRKFKGSIAYFDSPAAFIIDYHALILTPSIIFTSAKDVEDIKNSPIPQLIFEFEFFFPFTFQNNRIRRRYYLHLLVQ